jgi:methyltransferase (TIGR00027 family)
VRNHPSRTAAWVAACRSFGVLLPERERLADDPYGARFAGTTPLFRTPRLARVLFPHRALLYMQVRTRVIDDAMLDFLRGGGRQVVILGAGFDCRALRFARELGSSTVFEVDHPATQQKKREVLRGDVGARTEYVEWDFEKRAMGDLPAALAERGHRADAPTLTIWEGVTMYLEPDTIDACVRTIAGYSAAGSRLVFNYLERRGLEHPSLPNRLARGFVGLTGEPFRFGFDPDELPGWLSARGFRLDRDARMTELARELVGEAGARITKRDDRRIALSTRRAAARSGS